MPDLPRDAPAMADDLLLTCAKCSGKRVGLIYNQTDRIQLQTTVARSVRCRSPNEKPADVVRGRIGVAGKKLADRDLGVRG
jgi:hypothetical protein